MTLDQEEWGRLSPDEKKKQLYFQQKEVLDKFLERGAITKAEYNKSFGDLTRKMGMEGSALQSSQTGIKKASHF